MWYGAQDAVGTAEAVLEYEGAVSVEGTRRRQHRVYCSAHREYLDAARAPRIVTNNRSYALRMPQHLAAMNAPYR